MKDLHYRQEPQNKLPAYLISIGCALALSFLTLASSGIGYSAVFHALVLICGAFAIFFAYRYYLSYRTYHLTYMGGRHVLTVTDTQGKRIVTVFYLYLDEVENAALLSRAELKQQKRMDKTFIFSNTLRPTQFLSIDAKTELGDIRVLLSSDACFADALAKRVDFAKQESENA